MTKILTIARTEYLNAVRSKAFIVSVLALPILLGLSIGLQVFLQDKVDVTDRRFAVVDRTGRLFETIVEQARERNVSEVSETTDSKRKVRPDFVPEEFEPEDSGEKRTDVILSERVRKKELFAFVVIGKDVIAPEGEPDVEITYYTQTPTFTELPNWLERVINDEIKRIRFETAQLDQALVAKLSRDRRLKKLGLVKVSPEGEVTEARRDNEAATFGLPFASMFLLYMLVMTSTPALLNNVLEEKMQKIAEVLLSAASPFQLMLGKLFGAVCVSLTLSVLYLSAAVFLIWRFGLVDLVPPAHFAWFLLFQILALLIFGSLFSAIGAACSEIRDAQNMMFPAIIIIIIPFFVWMPVLQSPNSIFSRLLSLFPPFTPMLMMLRISIPPGPPWWEVVLGVVLTGAFMLACMWASGKIFRIGILAQGQTPSLARLVSWVLSK